MNPKRPYSRSQQRQGRSSFSWFQFINTLSFSFLAGNVLTLLLLRLGASNTLIGVVNSFVYLSFFFMPLGRMLVGKFGLVATFARAWGARYVVMIPVIFVPLLWQDSPGTAIPLIVAGYLGFQVFRGIGIVSFNPIMKALSHGKDQGTFLNRVQILVHLASISASLGVAFLIGREAPLWRYSVSLGFGSLLGIWATLLFTRLPEPRDSEITQGPGLETGPGLKTGPGLETGPGPGTETRTDPRSGLVDALARQWKHRDFKRFIPAFSLLICVSSLVRAFLPVYAKQVYLLGDDMVLMLNLAGSLGAVVMGLINRRVMDRLGAKPMVMIFTGILLLSLGPVILVPRIEGILGLLLLGGSFFLSLMGIAGSETSSQGYFYAILPRKGELDLGIWYYLIMGVAGSLGSALGGVLLDGLKTVMPIQSSFSVFFILAGLGILLTVVLQVRMDRLNASSLRSALSMLFSLRDWRAISMIQRLEGSRTIDQEQQVLRDLQGSSSSLPVEEVLERLSSPLFRIRRQALTALYYLPYSRQVQDALLEQIRCHQFATAYHAARIVGQRGSKEAIPVLREAVTSNDYLLAANSMLALADLGDHASRPRIEAMVLSHTNPMILVYGAAALRVFDAWESLPFLYQLGEQPGVPDYVVQEAAFSAAGILGLENTVYRAYREYQQDPEEGLALAGETLVKNHEPYWTEKLLHATPGELFHEAEALGIILSEEGSRPGHETKAGSPTQTPWDPEALGQGLSDPGSDPGGHGPALLEQARLLAARPGLMESAAFVFLCKSLILAAAGELPPEWYQE